jgi:NAD(P) transhydrogenase subunit alpha
LTVAVEAGAGLSAGIPDAAFAEAGAEIAPDARAALDGAGIVLKVRGAMAAGEGEVDELSMLPRGALLLGQLGTEHAVAYAERGVDAGSMELLPRTTRAQSMDILSSQANLAGYRAVIEAAAAFDRGFPMLMTAAGTVPAATVFVMGAGVAGLQAIATARRLGGRVSATGRAAGGQGGDQVARRGLHRPRGRGKPRGADRRRLRQADERRLPGQAGRSGGGRHQEVRHRGLHGAGAGPQGAHAGLRADGGEHEARLRDRGHRGRLRRQLRADQAGRGGGDAERCPHPRLLQLARPHPAAASQLYARNLLTFLTTFWDKEAGAPKLSAEDDIVRGVMLTRGGQVVHPSLTQAKAA